MDDSKIIRIEMAGCTAAGKSSQNHSKPCPLYGCVSDLAEMVTDLCSMVDNLAHDVYGETYRPFNEKELITAIDNYATAVAYSEQLLVWVPIDCLDWFLHPLLDDALEYNDIHIVLDSQTAVIDLTEICEVYGLDMGLVYDDCTICSKLHHGNEE